MVTVAGERIELGPRLRRVVASLSQRPGEIVSAVELIDAVWPHVEDGAARRRLQTTIWKLRKLLGPDARGNAEGLIRWMPPGYVLDVTERQVDWTRARRLSFAGERALQRGAPMLAKSYLSAALTLWARGEALEGIELTADDLGFMATQNRLRERARAALLDASLQLGDLEHVLPWLEADAAADPMDERAVHRLALAYYGSGKAERALSTCRRYLDLAEDRGLVPSPSIVRLQSAILRRDGSLDPDVFPRTPNAPAGSAGTGAYLCSNWATARLPVGLLTSELYLLLEDRGGTIVDAAEDSVKASFPDVGTALRAAIDVQRALGNAPRARVGIHAGPAENVPDVFDGPIRARARLLAASACEGQILVAGIDQPVARLAPPAGARLRPLGSHRLNAITPPAPVFQLVCDELPDVRRAPRWFVSGEVENLADDPYRLVGRDREIDEISRLLFQSRLVTLTGPPGSGKTKLAAHLARAFAREYRDGIFFVRLDPVAQPTLVPGAIADALRMPPPGPMPSGHALVRHLSDKHSLLVLDNCEHVLSEVRSLVDELLAACDRVTILATSRRALGSHMEQVAAVGPLPLPPASAPADVLLGNAAIQLLCERLGPGAASGIERAAFARREIEAIAQICRAMEGIPLALVLAAARAREVGVAALAEALAGTWGEGDGLRVLSGARNSVPEDRQTLGGALEWSYRLLRSADQRLLASLSVFRGDFTSEDAVVVCANGKGSPGRHADGLERLVQASLLVAQGGGRLRRYRLLQPIRDYAAGKLASDTTREAAVRRRHARHFLSVAEEAEPFLRGNQDPAIVDRLERALADLHAAIRWAVDEREGRTALRLVGALWAFWLVRGRITEGRQMLELALAVERAPSTERTKALHACAQLSWFSGQVRQTREMCREALWISEAIGDVWGWAWSALGFAATGMFDDEDPFVPVRLEEILPTFYALGNDWDTCQVLQTLGGAAWHRARYDQAEKVFAEAVERYRSLGHPTLMAALRNHGLMLALLGDCERGAEEVDHSIATAYEAGDVAGLGQALCRRGAIARYADRHEQARSWYASALQASSRAGDGWSMQWALGGVASVEGLGPRIGRERLETSVMLLARAEAMSRETGIRLAPRERQGREQDGAAARARLGEAAFREAFARGERLGLDEAVALALSIAEPSNLETPS